MQRNPADEANRDGGNFIEYDGAWIFGLKDFLPDTAKPHRKGCANDATDEKQPEISGQNQQREPADADHRTESPGRFWNATDAETLSEPEEKGVHMSSKYNARFFQR